ncbi:DUF4864 domain-containing protein [Oceaniglobus ichthyenteri]|uniref:DUF4864 domain-containing protein n=1 Tax=Oceaniglobus ichthyenteri TaxID=2136177 RepID=UPI000D3BFFE6|nr:DUF4864 domain-containing protein [Oceaniglobus ichthyenteri]
MTRLFMILTLAIGLAGPIQAQTDPMQYPAIERVIQGQIDAFLADDFATAFDYASPTIKSMFGSVDRFAAMVQQGYPMVHRPSAVEFQELREIRGELWQKVVVRDASGVYHALDYQMIKGEIGWQINGVQLLQAPQLGV